MTDLIDRQECIDRMLDAYPLLQKEYLLATLNSVPTAEPTLYGYKVKHLAFIARMMEMENIPPEKVIEVMEDAGRVVEMVLAEQKEIIDRAMKR